MDQLTYKLNKIPTYKYILKSSKHYVMSSKCDELYITYFNVERIITLELGGILCICFLNKTGLSVG